MTRTTRLQRQAIKSLWLRDTDTKLQRNRRGETVTLYPYRYYRRSAKPTFGMDGAIVVPIWSMFLCIERDGYTHS